MVSLLAPVSCDFQYLTPLLNFFGYPDGAVSELFYGTSKVRYSSTPFSKKFPSWPIPVISGHHLVVGSGPGRHVHIPDGDPVFERPAKRLRFTGKSSAVRCEPYSGDCLPTPNRWKRLVLQGTGGLRRLCLLSFFSCRGGLTSLSDTRDLSLQVKVSDVVSLSQKLLLPFNQLHVGTRLATPCPVTTNVMSVTSTSPGPTLPTLGGWKFSLMACLCLGGPSWPSTPQL